MKAPLPQVPSHALPRSRWVGGERWVARMLRSGAFLAGGMFIASLVLELSPPSREVHATIDGLRKWGASMLLATPVVRLLIAGAMLGVRGEWRYSLYAVAILALLVIALSAGVAG